MPRLLLIDDDIAEISAVKRVLARASLAPVLATNASDAMAALTQRPVDLLVVGATCEGGEAVALLQRLELDEATRGLPLILLGTAAGAPAHAVQLPRPVDPAALAEQVQLALSRVRAAPPAAVPAPAPTPAPRVARPPPPPRPPFERRGPPIVLPEPLERRAHASDAADARRAAAEALRARAEELRRPPETTESAAAEAAAGLDALFELAPPDGVELQEAPADSQAAGLASLAAPADAAPPGQPWPDAPAEPAGAAPEAEAPAAEAEAGPSASWFEEATAPDPAPSWFEPGTAPEPALSLSGEATAPEPAPSWFEPGLEADLPPIAETPFDLPPELELEAPPPPPPAAPPLVAQGRLLAEVEERARAEELLAAESEARRTRQEEALARLEAQAQEQAARLAEAEARRAREAEERARGDAAVRAEAAARAEEAAGRARQAEAAAREEAEARRLLESEVQRLRAQLDADREAHGVELRTAQQRAAAEEQAVAELRLHEASQATRVAVEEAASQAARRAQAEAEARAAGALEALRERAEAEASRRAEVEAALEKLSEEARRLADERAALAEAAAAAAQAAHLAPPAGVAEPEPPAAPEPLPSLADAPPPDEAQEAARRRARSLRQRREAPAVPPPPAWLQPWEPPAAAPGPALPPPAPEPEPEPSPPALVAPPAELREGTLDDLPAPRLLALAARARAGGRLDVTGDAARSLWLEDGRVVGAASNVPGERVEEVALRLGQLTRDQHHQVAATAASLATRRAALMLVERGYLKPAELTALVRRRTDEVVYGVFAEAHARFRWVPDPVPAEERVSPERPPLALAVEGVRRRWLAPRADAVLGGPASILAPAASPPTAAELGLSPEERRALALADGLRTLDEVLVLAPLDGLSARQLLAAAVLVGALSVRVVHAGRPAAQVSAAIDLARVREKLEQVRRADYFTILGIGRICTPHEVREAAERLLAELSLDRFQGVREEGLPARLEEIRRVVGEAREVLSDEQLRAEYLRGLPG